MGWSLIPRDQKFFEMFRDQAKKVLEGAHLLQEMMADFTDVEAKAKRIKTVESEADEICHGIFEKLNRSFITPIERDDIHELAHVLDEVLDNIEGVSSRFFLYGVTAPTPMAITLTDLIVKATRAVEQAVFHMESPEHVRPHLLEIHRLENEVDEVSRAVIGKLFHEEEDLRELIRWKGLYNRFEHCADRCEDVADIIEAINVKSA